MIKLSNNFEMNPVDYANEGNSDIGIRGSGKTHTATAIAEGLMDNNIPIVVFDPSAVWHNLRYGTNGNKGYPIVVAGGADGDLELTDQNAVNILDAAMKANISIVFDFSEIESKAKEIRIVADCVDHLMRFNKNLKTLRHVFIEEAAEYCPQKLNPGLFTVYSKIERMARMGRGFGLGFTLINQRSQEIAKAIFELCDRVFIHRQTGNNSLSAIDSWLKYKGIDDKNNIIQSLPKLNPGECWVIDLNGEHQIKVSPKKTFHPNPKKGIVTAPAGSSVDISGFIEKMRETMASESIKLPGKVTIKEVDVPKTKILQHKIDELMNTNAQQLAELNHYKQLYGLAFNKLTAIENVLADGTIKLDINPPPEAKQVKTAPEERSDQPKKRIPTPSVIFAEPSKPATSGQLRMLKAVAMYHPKPISKQRIATLAGLSMKSGTFGTYIGNLKRDGHIIPDTNGFMATAAGFAAAGEFEPLPTDPKELIETWCNNIGAGSGAARILRFLGEHYPNTYSKLAVGTQVGMSHTSGSFGTYLGTLKRNGLITVESGFLKAADELFI